MAKLVFGKRGHFLPPGQQCLSMSVEGSDFLVPFVCRRRVSSLPSLLPSPRLPPSLFLSPSSSFLDSPPLPSLWWGVEHLFAIGQLLEVLSESSGRNSCQATIRAVNCGKAGWPWASGRCVVRGGEVSQAVSPRVSEAGSSKRQRSPHGRFAGYPGAPLT